VSGDSHARQMLGSLLAAVLIVVLAITVVTLKFGPTSAAEQEALEERREQRIDAADERREAQEERREEAGEERER
jgi:hypothetical protein